MKIKLPIPYYYFHGCYYLKEQEKLSEFQAMIMILIKSKEEHVFKQIPELLISKFNINNEFHKIFFGAFNELKKTKTIEHKNEGEEIDFYETMIDHITINKSIDRLLDNNSFLKNVDKTKKEEIKLEGNILMFQSPEIVKGKKPNETKTKIKNFAKIIEMNKKINENIEDTLTIIGEKKSQESNNLSFIPGVEFKPTIKTDSRFKDSIYFVDEEIEFHNSNSNITYTNELTKKIVDLYLENNLYVDLPEILIGNLNSKIDAPHLDLSQFKLLKYKKINTSFLDDNLIFELNLRIISILDGEIIELFNKEKELLIEGKETKYFYNETYFIEKENNKDVEEIINIFIDNQENKKISIFYEKLKQANKNIIIEKILSSIKNIKENVFLVEKEFDYNWMSLFGVNFNIFIDEFGFDDNSNLFLKVLSTDASNSKIFLKDLKISSIDEIKIPEIIDLYKIDYEINLNNYFKNSLLENKIIEYVKESKEETNDFEQLYKNIISFIKTNPKLKKTLEKSLVRIERKLKNICEIIDRELLKNRREIEEFSKITFKLTGKKENTNAIKEMKNFLNQHNKELHKKMIEAWSYDSEKIHNGIIINSGNTKEVLNKIRKNNLIYNEIIKFVESQKNNIQIEGE